MSEMSQDKLCNQELKQSLTAMQSISLQVKQGTTYKILS
jgi:hypothetical protein